MLSTWKSTTTALGNEGHAERRCRPCAFFHAQGCQSGENCQFCHLCPPREVQRRKRLRRRLAREQEAKELGSLGSLKEQLKQSFAKSGTDSGSCHKSSTQPSCAASTSSQSFMSKVQGSYATSLNALSSLSSSIVPAGIIQPLFPAIAMRASASSTGGPPACRTRHADVLPTLLTSASTTYAPTKKIENAGRLQGACARPAEVSDSEDGSPTPFRCMDVAPLRPLHAPLRPTEHQAAQQRNTGGFVLVPVSLPVPMATMHVQQHSQ